MKSCLVLILSLAFALLPARSMAYDKVCFHCSSDTTVINGLLSYPQLKEMSKNSQVAFFARQLVGAQSNLRSDILDADSLCFTVDIHSFNPLSLISTCIALAQAYETSSAPNWRDFAAKYEDVMFKGGKATDFVSRFLYPSDWIADNVFRGNVSDASQFIEGLNVRKKEKTLFFISHNKELFKAFANPDNLDRIKMLEMGFRNHQIMYVSNGDLTNPKRYRQIAEDGDIVFFLATDSNLDCREMGIVLKDGDDLLFVQVSLSQGKVVIEDLPFENYVKRNIKRIQGARIIRIAK